MEAMLLIFCLGSLTISSIFVTIELARDRRKHKGNQLKRASLEKTPSVVEKKVQPPTRSRTAAPKVVQRSRETESKPQKSKVIDSLHKQLKALGYVSPNQQMGFVNRVLNSQCKELDEIDPNEIRQLFKVIRRYSTTENTVTPVLPQQSLAQTAASQI